MLERKMSESYDPSIGRPKPRFSHNSSSMKNPKGIEFGSNNIRSQNLPKNIQRPAKSKSMLDAHLEPYHGIEEKQSEYRKTFATFDGNEGRPKPSWYTWEDMRQPF